MLAASFLLLLSVDGLVRPFKPASLLISTSQCPPHHRRAIYSTVEEHRAVDADAAQHDKDSSSTSQQQQKPLESLLGRLGKAAATGLPSSLVPPHLALAPLAAAASPSTPLTTDPDGLSFLPPSQLTSNAAEVQTLRKELAALRARLDQVEKTGSAGGKSKTTISNFVDSLQANTMAMNARTVELCSVAAFFIAGTVVGASLLDRLWLLGGLFAAWWASGAVHRDTRGGAVARRAGVTVAQLIRDVQERYVV
jgi:hypothetical protein